MDPFRKAYRVLTPEEQARIELIKSKAAELHGLLEPMPTTTTPGGGGREFALARTKLEECVMWATKGLTG